MNFGVEVLARKAEARRGSAGAPGTPGGSRRCARPGAPEAAPWEPRQGQPPRGVLTAVFCAIRKRISCVTSPQASGDRDGPQQSPLPSRALLSMMLPRGGRAGAPRVSSSAEAAATDSYYGKSLHSCAKQSPCPTASRISHDLLPNTANASVRLLD